MEDIVLNERDQQNNINIQSNNENKLKNGISTNKKERKFQSKIPSQRFLSMIEFLLYTRDFTLAAACGIISAIFNLSIGKALVILIRDLIFLLSSIVIGFYRSTVLTAPILITPILVQDLEQIKSKSSSFRCFKLSGHLLIFFMNMSLGGLFGTKLVDLHLLKYPGDIFPIVVGIGTSSIQLANSFVNFRPFLKQKSIKIERIQTILKNGKKLIFK
uniref:GtrA domain-containing protein n=1 Tax=Meloidogyne hapla TaxID=6305 RepID=A0A1I8C2G1_MELHA